MCINIIPISARNCATTAVLCVVAASASAATDSARITKMQQAPVEELKVLYQNCNREALAGRLDGGTIMACSMVYEALKQRAFGGDFARLLAWSRAPETAAEGLSQNSKNRP